MSFLSQLIQEFVRDRPGLGRVWVAVSGGLDSTVLLHAAAQAKLAAPLLAIHINHQLSLNAGQWQQQVEQQCKTLAVPLVCETVIVSAAGDGLEQAARKARYDAIQGHVRKGDLVLMAHHQQDQAETWLLRAARGAGLRGLSAMPSERLLGLGQLGRPLLSVSRSQLVTYAAEHNLVWVEDESNLSERFDRNFLRLQVLPLLLQRWPTFVRQVASSAQLLRESDQLLTEYAAADLQNCKVRRERLGQSLDYSILQSWSAPRRNGVIRHWLQTQGYRPPSQKQMMELEPLLAVKADQAPLLNWGDCELRRYRQRLYCLPGHWDSLPLLPITVEIAAVGQTQILADGSRLTVIADATALAPGPYRIAARQDCPHIRRAHPAQRQHSQTLKKLLQEYALEPWLRERIPLVLRGDELVAVAGLWVERGYTSDSGGFGLRWSYPQDSGRASSTEFAGVGHADLDDIPPPQFD